MRVARVILAGLLGVSLLTPGTAPSSAEDSMPTAAGWGRVEDLSRPSSDRHLPAVAVGSAGDTLALWLHTEGRSPLRAAFRPHGGSWSAPESVPGSRGASELKVAFVGTGDALVVWLAGRRVRAIRRLADGAWTDPVTVHRTRSGVRGTLPVQLELAVNALGRAAVAWGNEDDERGSARAGGQLQAVIGLPDGTWGKVRTVAMGGFPDAVVDAWGRTTLVWTGGGGWLTRMMTATRDVGAGWTDPRPLTPLRFAGTRYEVAVRADGEVAVAYLSHRRRLEAIQVARRARDGDWVRTAPLVHGMQTVKLRAGTDGSGVVTVAWMSGHEALWVAENSPVTGWSQKRRVADAGQVGDDVWLTVNEAGDALLGWTSTPRHPVQALVRSSTNGWDRRPATVSAVRGESAGPALAIDPSGAGVMVWSLRPEGSAQSRVQASRHDGSRGAR